MLVRTIRLRVRHILIRHCVAVTNKWKMVEMQGKLNDYIVNEAYLNDLLIH